MTIKNMWTFVDMLLLKNRPGRWKLGLLMTISVVFILYFINSVMYQPWFERNPVTCGHMATSMNVSKVRCNHVYDYNWTILLAVNDGFYDFLSNWLWHYQRLGINVPIIIIAEDDFVCTKLRAQFPPNCNNSVTIDGSPSTSPKEAVVHGSVEYKKLVSTRPMHILKYLQEGLNVVYSDLDTVWLKNPFMHFNGSYDLWIEQEYGRSYCTGFMAIKSNTKTKKLVMDWQTGLVRYLQVNQPKFNTLLKKSKVKFKPLNETIFPTGTTFTEYSEQQRSNVVVMHNTFAYGHQSILGRFKELNLWYHTD